MKTLSRLQAAGYQVQLEGEEIVCRWQGSGKPDAAQVRPLIEELRIHKDEALEALRSVHDLPKALADWPEEWQEAYIERAAIMEYEGGLRRQEAEQRGEELVREQYRQIGGRT